MIKLTRLSGKTYYVNAEQIEFAEATPDTVITLLNGKKLVVSESIEDIVERVSDYHRQVGKSLYQKVLNRLLDMERGDSIRG
ncbi:MAG: flagellar protein [Candidatus Wallbacteria bacterium HGW-Wallbacteria-1]|jgi:flagellar protein FlbD|uniref:Flagellar protein n=1 Tax=Candidatus Wallbacteria bacterium HGW-Wallbacteria-1 TaxID=2013854 RepID=A0A2N1PSQ5_9BACT|nr:MAG: flagellar protein [Candidatus Wallbacteria bacterium HGW-Wallbacteria-1]